MLQACWRLTSAGNLDQLSHQLLEAALQQTEATYAALVLSSAPPPRSQMVWILPANARGPATPVATPLQARCLPLSWVEQCQSPPETVAARHPHDPDPYWQDHHPQAVIGLSFPVHPQMLGFLYLEQAHTSQGFPSHRQDLLRWLVTFAETRFQQLAQQSDLQDQLRTLDKRLAITQTRLEQALQESEQALINHLLRIQQLADHVPALIAYLDREERYRFANKHYEHLYGILPEQLIGRHVSEIIGETAYTRGADLAQRVWQGEQICFENTVVAITGKRHHLQVNMIPHKNEAGDVEGMFVLASDITPLKQVEATLRHKEALLQQALQAACMGAWEWDLLTDQERWWPEIEHLGSTGSHSDFLAQVHPEDRDRVMRTQLEAIQSHQPYQAVFRVVSPEGQIAWKSSQGTLLLNDQGDPMRMVGISADVTEQKQAEQALKEAVAAADAANRAKSSFLANMTHELRTPMNAILGFCQLLARDENLTPQQQQSLRVISRSGEHLLNQINAVLDMSKMEAGQISLQEQPCDLWGLLRELQDLFEPRIQAKLLQFQLTIAAEVPQVVVVDATKLRQALTNLLANALKFTHQGEITLSVTVEVHEQERYLCMVVQDTGEGISTEEIPHLFQPFVQSRSGIRSQQGTGLGLCICQQYVHLMGGSIALTSQLGQGSTFIIQIPCKCSITDLAPEDHSAVISTLISASPSPGNDLAQRLALQPLGWRQELSQAALHLDTERVLHCIHTLSEEDADLAQILIQWVEDFRFDHLADLLQMLPHE